MAGECPDVAGIHFVVELLVAVGTDIHDDGVSATKQVVLGHPPCRGAQRAPARPADEYRVILVLYFVFTHLSPPAHRCKREPQP